MRFILVSLTTLLATVVGANAASTSEAFGHSASQTSSPAITGSPSSTSSTTRVARTATINGFADAIYNNIPSCAKSCVARDTSSTRCPYWELGCLCVWSPWGSAIGECVAEACKGSDVAQFTQAATSACASYTVPAPYWSINSVASSKLASAAAETGAISQPATVSSGSTNSMTTSASSKENPSNVSTGYPGLSQSSNKLNSSSKPVSSSSFAPGSSSIFTSPATSVSSAPVSTPSVSNSAALVSSVVSKDSASVSSQVSTSQYLNETIQRTTAIDDVTVYLTNSKTITSTICTKCKTLIGPITTYTTVSQGIVLTVTAECSTSTPVAAKTSQTTATKDFSKSKSEGKTSTTQAFGSPNPASSTIRNTSTLASVSTRVSSTSAAPSVVFANAGNTIKFTELGLGLVMIVAVTLLN